MPHKNYDRPEFVRLEPGFGSGAEGQGIGGGGWSECFGRARDFESMMHG
jgi:hypothetical protein